MSFYLGNMSQRLAEIVVATCPCSAYCRSVDVLSEVIASMRTSKPRATLTDVRAPWALRLRPVAGAGFHVVLQGTAWLLAPEADAPLPLAPGDVVFLRSGREHVLCDNPDTGAAEYHPEEGGGDGRLIGEIRLTGSGARSVLLCGAYDLDRARPHPLIGNLPPVIHLPARHGRHDGLRSAVDLLGAELADRRPGADGAVPPLIDLLLFYILRAWLEERSADSTAGWAAALADPAVGRALRALHADPARAWTVQSLGELAGLSRAAFARRFAALVGEPPLAYLSRWRMTLAGQLLRESDAPLSAVAARTGYLSEFAFAKAFKREFGQAPGAYRREAGTVRLSA